MKTIGITTTIPIEVLLAKGYKVYDLNNLFVTSPKYQDYIKMAERDGFPKSMCAWIKGIYGACIDNNIKELIGVTEGDCSNTKVLIEVLKEKGVKIYPFAYPHNQKLEDVKKSIDEFMEVFDAAPEEVEEKRQELNKLRAKGREIDELTLEGKVKGFENGIFQLCLSDFDGSVEDYDKLITSKLEEFKEREPSTKKLNLAYIGVPPMFGNLHDFVEELDARFIYNEVQREFAFPRGIDHEDIYDQYHDYTYPYGIDYRIEELKKEFKRRNIHGIIHYTQAFCHKAIDNIILKKKLGLPLLNIEGDKSTILDSRTKLRVEAFVDMLHDKLIIEEGAE